MKDLSKMFFTYVQRIHITAEHIAQISDGMILKNATDTQDKLLYLEDFLESERKPLLDETKLVF